MEIMDWLFVATILFAVYTTSGLAGKHLFWFVHSRRGPANRKRIVGDMIGRRNMGSFNISGRTFRGNNIQITNNRIIIDGKDVTDEYETRPTEILEIKVLEGSIGNLTTDANVTCGEVAGYVDAGGSITCKNVGGNADAGGSISCGDVHGDVDAGGSVKCEAVSGNIDAGGSVSHG